MSCSSCWLSNGVLCDGWIRYPLLWNRPAESQDEIIRLMELLELMHGIPHQGTQIELLRNSTHRHFNERAPLIDLADDIEAGSSLPSTPICAFDAPIGEH